MGCHYVINREEIIYIMTLYEYMQNCKDDEITVFDADYDMETYFYKESSGDEWDKAMTDLAKVLNVVEFNNYGVTVDLSRQIEKNLGKMNDLFNICEIDEIMESMDLILAGNVSEKWLTKFVKAFR